MAKLFGMTSSPSLLFFTYKCCCFPRRLKQLQALFYMRKTKQKNNQTKSRLFNIFDKRELRRKSEIPHAIFHVKREYFYLHKKIPTTKRKYSMS